jgi:hypothetical protein
MRQIEIRIIALLFLSLWFSGCKNTDESNLIMDGPVGGSYYYVKNQTDSDFLVQFPVPVYDRSINSIISVDSTILISRSTTTKIFEDLGNFGFNPTPAHTFKEIKLYRIEGEQKTLVLNIKPVSNTRWISTIISRDKDGYGLTEYQLVLKKDELQ